MSEEQVEKLLKRLDTAWTAFKESYAGVPDAQLLEPGIAGDWSVKDILAHVTTWEEEALKHLPLEKRLLWGEHDPLVPAWEGEKLARAIGAELKVFDDVGHAVPEERPDLLAAELL